MTKTYICTLPLNNTTFTLYVEGGCGIEYRFRGGNITQNIPAYFVSTDPFCQKVLEESEIFRQGKVKFSKQTEKDVAEQKRMERMAAANAEEAQQAYIDEVNDAVSTEGVVKVGSVTSVGEAINYVADHFNIAVRTAAQAKKVALDNGVDFCNLKISKKG